MKIDHQLIDEGFFCGIRMGIISVETCHGMSLRKKQRTPMLQKYMKQKIPQVTLALFIFTTLILWLFYSDLPDGKLHAYALDVGQGDAIFVRTPGGKKILVDGGPENYVLERLSEVMSYFDRTIDMVILTHPHADHIDGLVQVLKRYEVKLVLLTGVEYSYSAYDEFIRTIAEKEIPFSFSVSTNDYVIEPGVHLDILYPIDPIVGEEFHNVNDSSIAAIISHGKTRLLLTGDAEIEEEIEILKTPANISIQLMKAGHHGSRTATSKKLLDSAQPRAVFITVGEDNKFDHPHTETLQLLDTGAVSIGMTKNHGTVEYVSDGDMWEAMY
jgi:competence protein ComEC